VTLNPIGEESLTLVAATFGNQQAAEGAAASLRTVPDLAGTVSVVRPGDPQAARKFEPDHRGIWRTMVRSHIVLGVIGALLGLGLSWWLIALPWEAAAGSPILTTVAIVMFSTFAGMMVGGLLTLRPDHSVPIRDIRSRMSDGQWAVVVRPTDPACAQAAFERLEALGGTPVRSL
jgi:hypothetical protein